jgi:hypothetical protein
MSNAFSLTPGFSPVPARKRETNRFNGFPRADKPLKRLAHRVTFVTALKRGVNETKHSGTHFANINQTAGL